MLSLFALGGCGIGPLVPVIELDNETSLRLRKEILVFENSEIQDKEYQRVGQIDATSCMNKLWDAPSSKEDAIDQLRYKVSALGGNGLTSLICEKREGTDLAKNCWNSVTCFGVAISVATPDEERPAGLALQQKARSTKQLDITPPHIYLQRGISVASRSRHLVIGIATDDSGVGIVEVNGIEAQLDQDGNFSANVILKPGTNEVEIVAYDIHSNQATKVINIQREVEQVASAQPIRTGDYHALLIAVEDYQHSSIDDLSQPIKDATRIRDVLQNDYTFDSKNITLLRNPDRRRIMDALDRLSKQVDESDNVLVFYAGHGDWDEQFQQGYWLPSDANPNSKAAWIPNGTIRDYIRGIKSKNTLLVSDACFAGAILNVRSAVRDASVATQELYELPARRAMTSGTLTEVPDRSVFLDHLAKRLESNTDKYLSSETLFARFKEAVINNSPTRQIPQIGIIREAGDEGGDFIFVRR
jgi:hypothetical protein